MAGWTYKHRKRRAVFRKQYTEETGHDDSAAPEFEAWLKRKLPDEPRPVAPRRRIVYGNRAIGEPRSFDLTISQPDGTKVKAGRIVLREV